jgi:hypothetical protein
MGSVAYRKRFAIKPLGVRIGNASLARGGEDDRVRPAVSLLWFGDRLDLQFSNVAADFERAPENASWGLCLSR